MSVSYTHLDVYKRQMYEGHIIYDVSGEEKKNLHVSDLLAKFQIASGGDVYKRQSDLSDGRR